MHHHFVGGWISLLPSWYPPQAYPRTRVTPPPASPPLHSMKMYLKTVAGGGRDSEVTSGSACLSHHGCGDVRTEAQKVAAGTRNRETSWVGWEDPGSRKESAEGSVHLHRCQYRLVPPDCQCSRSFLGFRKSMRRANVRAPPCARTCLSSGILQTNVLLPGTRQWDRTQHPPWNANFNAPFCPPPPCSEFELLAGPPPSLFAALRKCPNPPSMKTDTRKILTQVTL